MKKKEEKVYNFSQEEMILRDFLAADRTLLANERTLLAYIRTSIGLLAIAISLIKLFDDTFTYIIGIIFIVLSVVPLVVGISRYRKVNRKLEKVIYK